MKWVLKVFPLNQENMMTEPILEAIDPNENLGFEDGSPDMEDDESFEEELEEDSYR